MPIALLLSLMVLPATLAAQTPPAQPTTPPPATAPAKPRAAKPAARTALVVTVTDPQGATLPGVRVDVLGAADRSGETDDSGTLRLANMRPGTYRVRFSGAGVIAFEREIVVRAGQTTDLDVTLNPAPEPPEPEAPDAPPEAVPQEEDAPAPPMKPGDPKLASILDLLEKDFIGRQPRKETLLGCSVSLRSTMIQLNEAQPERLYEDAESAYYVLGGEGTVRLNGRESPLVTGSFALIPRGVSHAFIRKGRRPLILLAILSGEACGTTP